MNTNPTLPGGSLKVFREPGPAPESVLAAVVEFRRAVRLLHGAGLHVAAQALDQLGLIAGARRHATRQTPFTIDLTYEAPDTASPDNPEPGDDAGEQ